ncbi:MAG: hypothetical protein WAX69_14135 [Victivallales bacterium]
MMKIVTKDIAHANLSGTKPINTLYRMGRKYGRVERPELKYLLVVSEPDVWMVNLADKTGEHVVDPGPTFVFKPCILPPLENGLHSPSLLDFEFGREHEFMKACNAIKGGESVEGKQYDSLTVDKDGYSITLLSHAGKDKPFRITANKGKDIAVSLEYLEYESNLEPQMDLFKPPADVKIKEAKKP